MTDEEKIQCILEGRCIFCKQLLPKHDIHCKLSPNRQIQDRLDNISNILEEKLTHVTQLAQNNKVSLDELKELIDQLHTGKDKDV